ACHRACARFDQAAHGHRQVRAGVAVGHRVDVEVVDSLTAQLERVERAAGEAANGLEVAHAVRFTSWMWTSTDATRRPVSRSTSYATCERTVAATSARFSPYATTTYSSTATAPVCLGTAIRAPG